MANERLRVALMDRGETPASIAAVVKVDPKTVERWLGGRIPYTRSRYLLARHLKLDETYLWPTAVSPSALASLAQSEVITHYPNRSSVPDKAWSQLFDSAEEEIGILVYAGGFLFERAGVRAILQDKAAADVQVRVLLGDPDSHVVSARGADEGIEDALASRVRESIVMLRPLAGVRNVEIRLHTTILYTSIYRADEELLVNPHIYGVRAADAPVTHLRRTTHGTMVPTYLESFDRVWAGARPLTAGT